MIRQFDRGIALLLVDVQKGVDDLKHWGGPAGRRNNPLAESRMLKVLAAWRKRELPVIFTQHDSREANSPLRLSQPSGAFKEGFEPAKGDLVVRKDVNSAFIGTPLEIELRRRGISRLLISGFFTNMCISTTVRMSNNLGFDTYLIHDGCACANREQVNGTDVDPEVVHDVTIATLHREFCTALTHSDALSLIEGDRADLVRVQGNE
jgi:nicotinamidase-related amidase